jgi:hypothetical protein
MKKVLDSRKRDIEIAGAGGAVAMDEVSLESGAALQPNNRSGGNLAAREISMW